MPRRHAHEIEEIDGRIPCLVCGRTFKVLGTHLVTAHAMTSAQYRARFGLPATTPLAASQTRAALSEATARALEADPGRINRMRAALPGADELAQMATEGRRLTNGLEIVRRGRRNSRLRMVEAASAARAEAVEAKAREAGFASMAEAIDSTSTLTGRAAARRIGVSEATVRKWRQKA